MAKATAKDELVQRINQVLSKSPSNVLQQKPTCFLSYCWSNSQSALVAENK